MKMKHHFFLSLAAVLLTTVSIAQTGLSNQLVWAGNEFNAEYVDGLASLNDGLHYTGMEQSDAFGTRIVKYSYETGKEVGVMACSVDVFKDATKNIEGYQFSADEKQILIQTES